MRLQRVRRPRYYDDWPICDVCERASDKAYCLTDDDGRRIASICDGCMKAARAAGNGWYNPHGNNPEEDTDA
jgi:hypothetical protein